MQNKWECIWTIQGYSVTNHPKTVQNKMLTYESWAGWQKQYHSSSSQIGPDCFGRGFTLQLAMFCICLCHIIIIKGKMLSVLLFLHSVPSHAKKVKIEVPLFSFIFPSLFPPVKNSKSLMAFFWIILVLIILPFETEAWILNVSSFLPIFPMQNCLT